MCVVSMVGDHYTDKWKNLNPPTNPLQPPLYPPLISFPNFVTREAFEELKKEVLQMKELLRKANEYDKRNNEPDCHTEEKLKTLREIAKLVGVTLEDALK